MENAQDNPQRRIEFSQKRQALKRVSDLCTELYCYLTLNCHDSPLAQSAKDQITLAHELCVKTVQKDLVIESPLQHGEVAT